jgi:Planctomycete cytochrome C
MIMKPAPRILRAAPLLLALTAGCSAFDPQFGGLLPVADAGAEPDEGDGGISFAREIRPLMNRSSTDTDGHGCKRCHYATEPTHVGLDLGGLDLSTLGGLRKGGATSGSKIVIPGDPDGSALVQKLTGTYDFGARMPRDGPAYWADDDIGYVRAWIAAGAKGADSE